MKVYCWDEVGCEVTEFEQRALPSGLTPWETMVLVDARITAELGSEEGTYARKVRDEGGTLVLEARFGRDKVTRTYLCLEDPARARELAEKELAAWIED